MNLGKTLFAQLILPLRCSLISPTATLGLLPRGTVVL